MIIIGNSLSINSFIGKTTKNKPLIGWHSIIAPDSPQLSGGITSERSPTAIWTPSTVSLWVSDPITSATPIIGYIQLSNELTTSPVNYFGMIGDNFANIGASYTLEYYSEEDWHELDAVKDISPARNKLRFHYFDTVAAEKWRLKIMHPGGEDIVFKIGHIKLGVALVLQRAMYVGLRPTTLDKTVRKLTQKGSTGKYLDNVVRSYNFNYEIKQPNNDPTFVRTFVEPFLNHMEGILENGNSLYGYGPLGTCFYAWRWDEYPDEVVYCHSPDSVEWPKNQRPNKMMEWGLRGTAEI